MSGDLRAKKNARLLKTGGHKKGRQKRRPNIQSAPSDSQEEMGDEFEQPQGSAKAFEFMGNKEENTEEDDDEGFVAVKVGVCFWSVVCFCFRK